MNLQVKQELQGADKVNKESENLKSILLKKK
jgi:hypothetical protein